MQETLFACPCCGYHTFGAQPPGTYIVCPVCFWEDLPAYANWPEGYCGALHRAQRTYQRLEQAMNAIALLSDRRNHMRSVPTAGNPSIC